MKRFAFNYSAGLQKNTLWIELDNQHFCFCRECFIQYEYASCRHIRNMWCLWNLVSKHSNSVSGYCCVLLVFPTHLCLKNILCVLSVIRVPSSCSDLTSLNCENDLYHCNIQEVCAFTHRHTKREREQEYIAGNVTQMCYTNCIDSLAKNPCMTAGINYNLFCLVMYSSLIL